MGYKRKGGEIKMEVKEIAVNVSKKIGQPQFGSIMLSASMTITANDAEAPEAYNNAWSTCWEEILKQEEEFKKNSSLKEAMDEFGDMINEPTVRTAAPKCGNHPEQALIWRKAGISKSTGKAYPAFWSCPIRTETGAFCTYKYKG